MKVLLRDLTSLKFLGWDGKWTLKPEEAMDFGDVTRAVTLAM